MIPEIKLDIDQCEANNNRIDEIVLSAADYKVCFNELPENTTLHNEFCYPTTISKTGHSYIIFTDEYGERHHTEIGGSKPFNVPCE